MVNSWICHFSGSSVSAPANSYLAAAGNKKSFMYPHVCRRIISVHRQYSYTDMIFKLYADFLVNSALNNSLMQSWNIEKTISCGIKQHTTRYSNYIKKLCTQFRYTWFFWVFFARKSVTLVPMQQDRGLQFIFRWN